MDNGFKELTENFNELSSKINTPESFNKREDGHEITVMNNVIEENLNNILSEKNLETLTEGSILEYEDFGKEHKDFGKLYKEIEKAYGLKEQVTKSLFKMLDHVDSALKISRKMKEGDFPMGTKETGGKESTEWSLNNIRKKLIAAEDLLNTRIG